MWFTEYRAPCGVLVKYLDYQKTLLYSYFNIAEYSINFTVKLGTKAANLVLTFQTV